VATEERRDLLQKNGAHMQRLFDLFSKMEQGHLEERQKRVEQQQNDLAALRLHDAEDYTSLKARCCGRAHVRTANACFGCRSGWKATCRNLSSSWRRCALLIS
jgi:hypothetical protein